MNDSLSSFPSICNTRVPHQQILSPHACFKETFSNDIIIYLKICTHLKSAVVEILGLQWLLTLFSFVPSFGDIVIAVVNCCSKTHELFHRKRSMVLLFLTPTAVNTKAMDAL